MDITLEKAAQLIAEHRRVALTTHASPDGDGLGSMLALTMALAQRGQTALPLLAEPVPRVFDFLPGVSRILVLPQTDTALADVDLLVSLDSSDAERIDAVRKLFAVPVINIDHHVSNTRFGDFNCVQAEATATGELVYNLFAYLRVPFTHETATCLYTAIATDCGFFRYANTTATTHLMAAELLRHGVDPALIADRMETKPAAGIKLLAAALQQLEFFHHGQTAAMVVDMRQVPRGLEDVTEGFINYPRYIEGVETALLFKVADDNAVKVSLRSRNRVDVSAVALAFGGGGHKRAAGCTMNGELPQVKTLVLREIAKQLPGEMSAGDC